jgi:acetyl-CoA carboxylase biotin carboxylase subunit
MALKKLFVANRGEIAVRIQRAARLLNIPTVQAYSEADSEMMAVKMADEAVCIGPARASDSYLNSAAVISAALASGADSIHPGYGFLSENPAFVRAVSDAGLIFVGPSAEVIERMGDKAAAREAATAANIPVVPGSPGRIETIEHALAIAKLLGYPVMVKAAAGGGGRGIRIAQDAPDLRSLIPQAQSEALSAFGDGGLYLEKFIRDPRHIEVQILADGARAVHCFERECSLQRRRQKVWEEAPATNLPAATRAALCEASVRLAESVSYKGAGTVEFIYDDADDRFYFIEMNTRIQVEHPITEAITGIDLVAAMIRIAGGEPLGLRQDEIRQTGHAIEVRINAEDPARNFMPFPGRISAVAFPAADGVRVDHFLHDGYAIQPFYDSLLAKIIAHGETRDATIEKLDAYLAMVRIDGVKHTIPLHQALCRDEMVRDGQVHTQWLETWLAQAPFAPVRSG